MTLIYNGSCLYIIFDHFVVDGRWSSWRPVGGCSKTCGGGILKFIRTCTKPSCGGISCRGSSTFEAQCNTACCLGMYN